MMFNMSGIISAEIDGEKIVVVGDGIDSVTLVVMLRKKMGYAELDSVAAVEEKKEGKKDEKKDEKKDGGSMTLQPVVWPYGPPQPFVVEERSGYNDPCRIM